MKYQKPNYKRKKHIVKWKQVKNMQTDITEMLNNSPLSIRELAKKCNLHYTYLSKAINGDATMTENSFAKFVTAIEDSLINKIQI